MAEQMSAFTRLECSGHVGATIQIYHAVLIQTHRPPTSSTTTDVATFASHRPHSSQQLLHKNTNNPYFHWGEKNTLTHPKPAHSLRALNLKNSKHTPAWCIYVVACENARAFRARTELHLCALDAPP